MRLFLFLRLAVVSLKLEHVVFEVSEEGKLLPFGKFDVTIVMTMIGSQPPVLDLLGKFIAGKISDEMFAMQEIMFQAGDTIPVEIEECLLQSAM